MDRDHDLPDRFGELLRYGTVASVDLAAGKCTVAVGDVRTGPIRWLHGASGATASWSPPTEGEQVMLLCPEGDLAGAIALRGVHSDAHPPAGSTSRELIRYPDGAVLAYDPDAHRLDALLPAGATAHVVAPAGLTIEGDVEIKGGLTIDGQVYATDSIHTDGDVTAHTVSLQHHVHDKTQPGGGVSGTPVA